MYDTRRATSAYKAMSALRGPKDKEADVLRHVSRKLRAAESGGSIARAQALADNSLLWSTLLIVLSDPANQLPAPMRGGLISIGIAARKEMEKAEPDLGFLASVLTNIADGLSPEITPSPQASHSASLAA